MSLKMTKQERETFLAALHVGVISFPRAGLGPLTLPIWYDYEPGGDLWFITERASAKGKLISEGGRISLCAQSEEPPAYKYVSVEGPVVSIVAAVLGTTVPLGARAHEHTNAGPLLAEKRLAGAMTAALASAGADTDSPSSLKDPTQRGR